MPVMLVVEDNIRYYSSFLPVIYTELHQTVAAPDQRRAERGAQAGAHAGPSQDSAGVELRGSRRAGVTLSRAPAGRGARMWSFRVAASSCPRPGSNWRA